jgi:hypothetical protein
MQKEQPFTILKGFWIAACSALFAGALLQPVYAQSTAPADPVAMQELESLIESRRELAEQMDEFDRRIEALEERLGAETAVRSRTETVTVAGERSVDETPDTWGTYEPGKGMVLARTDHGEVNWTLFTYVRYLNQFGLEDSYTDSFGRTFDIDKRNDIQFAKVNLSFKGWLFDPKFRYLAYTWTSNTSQGDPAQVVVAGNLGYQFNEAFNLYAGIGALPSTRSTNYTFPNWHKNDHRTIADEYFRGSYTTGIWANGKLAPGLEYRAMVGNNLSQLGVNAPQLDDGLNTFSGALWWMPTTGEYGPGTGLGDYEWHDELATLFGIHYTTSREDAQGQPGTEGFENSQIRLSDGTRIFSEDPFLTGGNVRKADYQMLAINAGAKYRGWHLEGEAYFRKVDNFQTTGPIPVSKIEDHGFQIQGSYMIKPRALQAYAAYSKIFGDNGEPWDFSTGINWWPFDRKEMRLNLQFLYLDKSPVGYSSVPFIVGGDGWVVSTDAILAF